MNNAPSTGIVRPGRLQRRLLYAGTLIALLAGGVLLNRGIPRFDAHDSVMPPLETLANMASVAEVADRQVIIVAPLPVMSTPRCDACGVVTSMRLVTVANEVALHRTVEGAVVGGTLGGLIGGARGQELFSLLGAVAAMRHGGLLQPGMGYETRVRFDNGASRIIMSAVRPQLHTGDRVRVVNSVIQVLSLREPDLKLTEYLIRNAQDQS